jgi:transposase
MSLQTQAIGPVPEETARIARAAYPRGNLYLQLRDTLGTIYEDEQFADLFPSRGQPAEAPWRLALVCVMQFLEGLSDRKAADAVRGRLDWKYLLGLELSDPGFDHPVLVEFRQRLLSGKSDLLLFDLLLSRLREGGYLRTRGRQRSDCTHVLAKIRALKRVEGVGETFRAALNSLAVAAPEWLTGQMQEEWVERYEHRIEDYRLPDGKQAREDYAVVIGKDGGRACSRPSMEQRPLPGCARCLRCKPCDGCGCRISTGRKENCAGATPRRCQQPGSVSILPRIPKRIMHKNAVRVGSATKCISPRRARRTCLT